MQKNTRNILANLEREYGCIIPELTAPPMGSISLQTLRRLFFFVDHILKIYYFILFPFFLRICTERMKIFFMLEKVSYLHDPFTDEWISEVLLNLKKSFSDTYRICTEHSHRFRQFKALHYDRISRFVSYHVIVNSKVTSIANFIITNETRLFRCHNFFFSYFTFITISIVFLYFKTTIFEFITFSTRRISDET